MNEQCDALMTTMTQQYAGLAAQGIMGDILLPILYTGMALAFVYFKRD